MSTWFPILGAPAAWLLQGLVAWLVADWSCTGGGAPRAAVLAVSGVALAVALAALAAGAAAWRRSGNRWLTEVAGWTRPDFAAASATLVSAAFVLAIVTTTVGAFLLGCGATR